MRIVFPAEPREFSTRERSAYLWPPKCIKSEFRWLEHATWRECYLYGLGWLPQQWTTPEPPA